LKYTFSIQNTRITLYFEIKFILFVHNYCVCLSFYQLVISKGSYLNQMIIFSNISWRSCNLRKPLFGIPLLTNQSNRSVLSTLNSQSNMHNSQSIMHTCSEDQNNGSHDHIDQSMIDSDCQSLLVN